MSKRAEKRALEAYPTQDMYSSLLDGSNGLKREVFIQGYEFAEKDLGWISIKDRLPEKRGYYITCVAEYYKQEHVPQCVGVTLFNGTYWEDDDDPLKKELVDYWMRIPELPEEE